MIKVFWANYHSIMFCVIFVMWMFAEILKEGKELGDSLKRSNDKVENDIGETIMLIVIMLAIAFWGLHLISKVVSENPKVAIWFVVICGVIYAYIAIKQIVKIFFIPEKRTFALSDIRAFAFTYLVWWFIVSMTMSTQLEVDKILYSYSDITEVGIIFVWYYFNLLFALEGMYILLYCLGKIGEKLTSKFGCKDGKIENITDTICNSWQHGKKNEGLRSFRLWKLNNGKGIIYKLFMTVPLLLFDIWEVSCLILGIFIKAFIAFVIASVIEPIRALYRYLKKLWNRHNNNEWMYVFAQIAGLCSYVIVFLIIQYGEYEEVTKAVYEFAGTIILIPYFVGKIVKVEKKQKGDESEVSPEGEKEHAILENMTYNEEGEGVIAGKTIRQLEYEAVQHAANNPQAIKSINDKKLKKELRHIGREYFQKKASRFLENNIEIIVGICISVCLVCLYFVFKSPDTEKNISMIGSIIGAEGTMISVLLTIAFTKKSNEKALSASVLPYLTVEKEKKPAEGAYAFEYIKDTDKKRNFSVWRRFDFEEICDDKIKLVRNGITYLHIKNIGIGPAIHLKMKIENFSFVCLPIDYLRPDEEIYLILNFNNPDEGCQTDIIFEYETIRGKSCTQRFHANITWHLDRTNFTLFG